MLEILMILYTIYILIKIYISVMQIGFIAEEKEKKEVLLNSDNYKKAGNYAIKKERLNLFSSFIEYFIFIFWILFGFKYLSFNLILENQILESLCFLFIFFGINYIITLPLSIYQTFKIDKEYGFTKTTTKLYIQDEVKSIIIFFIAGIAILSSLIWIIINIENWWLFGFFLMFLLAITINIIYPTIIAPIFNKFSPLEEGELKRDIEEMMNKVSLKSNGIFTMDASKRDSRLNAYFGGLGKTKRVVLFDTLIEKLNNKELLAVLGHELGHFKNGDIWKNIGMMGVLLFITFLILGNISDAKAGEQLSLMILISPLIAFVFTPILSFISRHNEYEADNFGSKMGGKDNLISALIKLVDENKSFPKSHPLVIFFYHSHPPILERLKELGYKY